MEHTTLIKLVPQLLGGVVLILTAILDYVASDKRTKRFRRLRLILLEILGVLIIFSIISVFEDDRNKHRENQQLSKTIESLQRQVRQEADSAAVRNSSLLRQLKKSDNQELIALNDRLKKFEKTFIVNNKNNSRAINKDEPYIKALLSCLQEFAILTEASNVNILRKQNINGLFETQSKITVSSNLSDYLFLHSKIIFDKFDVKSDIILQITGAEGDSFASEIIEMKNGILSKKPMHLSYVDLERYVTLSGFYVKSINLTKFEDNSQMCQLTLIRQNDASFSVTSYARI